MQPSAIPSASSAAPVDDDERAVSRLSAEIDAYERSAQRWIERGKRIVRRYRDERHGDDSGNDTDQRFNILWSNVQTLLPAYYARDPQPDVSRRFSDSDPVGREAARSLERCLSYFVHSESFGHMMRQVTLDFILPGRGTVWVRYVPHFREVPTTSIAADTPADPLQQVYFEETVADYVHWQDFGHNVAGTWQEVWLVWRKVRQTRTEIRRRFGREAASAVTYENDDRSRRDGLEAAYDREPKAVIYECWDRTRREVVWLQKDAARPLEVREDPLELEGFFPCPRPLSANTTTETLIPVPDYTQYQDQARELDFLTKRIASIEASLKVVGVYDASAAGVDKMLAATGENRLIPIQNWAAMAEKGGIANVIAFMPLAEIAKTLEWLYAAREKVKQDLYEITGIADIIRGRSDPDETASAVRTKGQFATLRLSDRQRDVQRFVRDTLRIMGEITAKHFSFDTIRKISGLQLMTAAEKQALQSGHLPPPQYLRPDEVQNMIDAPTWDDVMHLLRDDPGRCFRIDIESDSTIKSDQMQERADRLAFLQAVSDFMSRGIQAAQATPDILPVMAQLLMFGVRAFPVGKEVEQAIGSWVAQQEKNASDPNQQKPDPAMAKVQAQQQTDMMKLQVQQQSDQARAQADSAIAQSKMQAQMQAEREKIALQERLAVVQQQAQQQQALAEIQARERERMHEAAMRMHLDEVKAQHAAEIERFKAEMQRSSAVEVAEINAKAHTEAAKLNAKERKEDDE
jgi:hypothetical protein